MTFDRVDMLNVAVTLVSIAAILSSLTCRALLVRVRHLEQALHERRQS